MHSHAERGNEKTYYVLAFGKSNQLPPRSQTNYLLVPTRGKGMHAWTLPRPATRKPTTSSRPANQTN